MRVYMVDFTLPRTEFFDEQASGDTGDLFGAVLEQDLSSLDIMADPLIKHYAQASHFLDYNMTLRRHRAVLKTKFFVKGIFDRKPKRQAKLARKAAKVDAKRQLKKAKRQAKIAKKAAKRHARARRRAARKK